MDNSSTDSNYDPEITTSDTFEFNGQTWYLVASTKQKFELNMFQKKLPSIVLGSGIVVSFIFLGTYLYIKKEYQTPS